MIRGLASAAAVGWTALLAASRTHAGAIRPVPAVTAPAAAPSVSIVVPARDEERDVERTLRLLSAQRWPDLEIVAVDDCSRDGTRAAIARAAEADPRIVAVDGTEPPPGWLGKPWACAQGAERARGEWLCFTDADVRFAPDALASAYAFAERGGRGGATLSPLLESGSFWERTVQPVAAMAILALVAPPALSQHPDAPVALAAGAFMLLPRALYERAGGHAAVRDRVADDLALGLAVKRAGGMLVLGDGRDHLAVRMYRGRAELWRGWRKNAAYGLPGGVPAALAGAGAAAVGGLAPPAALALGLVRRDRGLAVRGAIGLGALLALRAAGPAVAPSPRRYVATAPLGVGWIAAVTAAGALDRLRGGSRWRGRRYPFAR